MEKVFQDQGWETHNVKNYAYFKCTHTYLIHCAYDLIVYNGVQSEHVSSYHLKDNFGGKKQQKCLFLRSKFHLIIYVSALAVRAFCCFLFFPSHLIYHILSLKHRYKKYVLPIIFTSRPNLS